MYICTLSKSQVSEVLHTAQFPLRTWRQSCYYLWAIVEREANFSDKLYSICFTSCTGLAIPVLCGEGTSLAGQTLRVWSVRLRGNMDGYYSHSHDTAKDTACENRSKPQPSPAFLAVGSTPRAKRTRLLALLESETLSHHACVFGVRTIE